MRHFRLSEFKCPCCGENEIQTSFLRKIDSARDIAGVPFVINSGYRCPEHNRAVGGKRDSSHLLGYASDIKTESSRDRYHILYGLIQSGFNRIGIGKDFIHVDDDPDKPSEVVWGYYE